MAKPTLTSIEGGRTGGRSDPPGPRDYNPLRDHLHKLVVELLRAVARGDDTGARVTSELIRVTEGISMTKAPLGLVVDEVIRGLFEDLLPETDRTNLRGDLQQVVLTALQLAAETCAVDNAAGGRASKRKDALMQDIEDYIAGREKRSRANGWSLFSEIEKRHGLKPKPAARRPKP